MRICLISDEVSNDPATAFELGRRWGVEDYEIRNAYRFRVPFGPDWAADRVVAAVKDYGVRVPSISPGIFKPVMNVDGSRVSVSTGTPDELRRHVEVLLPASFRFAERLGARDIIVFPPADPDAADAAAQGAPSPAVVDNLSRAAAAAQAAGFRLLLENSGGASALTGREARALLDAVNSPALRMVWDPANVYNSLAAEDAVREGYPLVRPYVAEVHVKDVAMVGGQPTWAMFGDGLVDWAEQFRLLRQDGYAGFITLEPHLQYQPGLHTNLVERVEEFLRRVRAKLGE